MSEPKESPTTIESPLDKELGGVLGGYVTDHLRAYRSGEKVVEGVDISDPRQDDMAAISSGLFEVRRVQTAPAPKGQEGLSYHFYVGKPGESRTEVHIQGDAAKQVAQRIEAQKESVPQK